MLSVEEAIRRVLDSIPSPKPAELSPLPSALHRVLAEPVVAGEDVPPFARSAMDGYAVRSEDLATVPAELLFSGEVVAGSAPGTTLPAGGAIKIMTGAPVPFGADCVVPVEKCEPAAFPGFVRLLASLPKGSNVVPQGSEVRSGQPLLEPGVRLRPAEIALLALLGQSKVPVRPVSRVAVLATGDELMPSDAARPLPPGRIRNSNGPMLLSCFAARGVHARDLGIAADDPLALRVLVREGLRDDMLVVSGGVSVGERDLVAPALEAEGVETLFQKVAVKPGKPLLFGRRGGTLVFGLPGNPLSAFVGFQLFVAPAISAMEGECARPRRRIRAILSAAAPAGSDREEYRPAKVEVGAGEITLEPLPWRGSADLVGLCRANALQVVPVGAPASREGERVEAILLDWN